MNDSLRAFCTELIDYAGLFPPAQLALEPAVTNYLRYCKEPDAWMLGRFIIPAARLSELDPLIDDSQTLRVSALGRGGADEHTFLAGLERDLEDIDRCHDRHGRHVAVEVYEVKLPATFGSMFLAEVGKLIDGLGEHPLTPYLEAAPGPQWAEAIAAVAHDRAEFRRKRCGPFGCKLRCGGVEAKAFPTTEQVAECLAQAIHANVPIKCTAGLHHPIRRHDDSVNTKMHGFLNVFGAGILGAAHRLDAEKIRRILEDEESGSFAFKPDGFYWRDLKAAPLQVVNGRNEAVISYGSCSFDEPREDLRALGILK